MRNLLHRAGYIEKMGTGINKMRGLMAEAGLPPIEFEFGTFFTATFRRPEVREAAELETRVEGMFSERYIENFSVKMIESLDLPPLPEGWVWTKVINLKGLSGLIRDGIGR